MSRIAIINLATTQVGISENPAGTNKQKYGEWYGMNGVAWCAIFVSWVYAMSGHALGHVDTDKGFHYVPSGYNWFKAHNKLTLDPQPGDVVIFDWEKGTPGETAQQALPDHTGLFLKWLNKAEGLFQTIEGNTSAGNQSNGGQVQKRTRSIAKVKGFVNVLTLI